MRFNYLALAALPSLIAGAALPQAGPQVTDAPLVKRDQEVLMNSIWTSSSSGIIMAITPTVIDGVTISASPVTNTPTVWASLDSSGIPTLITPTVNGDETTSASPSPTDSSYPTPAAVPPVLRCFGDRVPDSSTNAQSGYPFCTVRNGTEMLVGETYWLTWDPTYWGSSDISRVKIELQQYPAVKTGNTIFETEYISNADAYYPLTIDSSFITSNNNGYFWVVITPLTTSTTVAVNTGSKEGPLVRAIASKSDASTKITRVPSDNGVSTSSSSSGSNKSKVIAPAVVVPVIVVIAIAIFVVWFLAKQKKTALFGLAGKRNNNNNSREQRNTGTHELSPTSTHADNATITTSATNDTTKNPFSDTSRAVL